MHTEGSGEEVAVGLTDEEASGAGNAERVQSTSATVAPVEGPAFSRCAKCIAGALMAYLLFVASQVVERYGLATLPASGIGFVAVVLALLLYTYYWILVSRTSLDDTTIRQTWLRNKEVRIADITKIKFISVPGLEWLIAPRMVVQVRTRGSFTFYAAEPQVMRGFVLLSLGLR